MLNYLWFVFIFAFLCSGFGCERSRTTESEAIIMHYIAPPPAGNYLDSMRMAFVNAIEVSREANVDNF